MKKRIFVWVLAFIVIMFAGCDIYADRTKKDMELIDIQVYDQSNREISGTYQNFRIYDYENENAAVSFTNEIVPVNSAAPVENYYFVKAKENESYTVKFTFYSLRGYKLTKIFLYNDPEIWPSAREIECDKIEKVGANYVATLTIDKVEKTTYYHVFAWHNGQSKITFGTKGSNTYIKGVCFLMGNSETLSC